MEDVWPTIPGEKRPLLIKSAIQIDWRNNPELTAHILRMARLRTRYRLIAAWLNTQYNVSYFTVGIVAGVVYRERHRS